MTTVERPIVQTFRLSEDERATLEALAEHEERAIGDVIRRALRAYAEKAGVVAKRTKETPRKTRRKTALPKKGGRPGMQPEPLCPSQRSPFHEPEERGTLETY